jgi:hypothetical protein
MKNILLKAALVLGSAFLFQQGSAQTSHFEDAWGNDVTGDTMDYWVAANNSHQIHFDQVNTSGAQQTYKFYKTNTVITSTATTWFCVFHNADAADLQSQCYIPTTQQSANFVTEAQEFNQLLCDYAAGSVFGITIVRYRAVNINDPMDTAVIWLRYNATPVGIAEPNSATLGEPYPNPATDNISALYSFINDNGGTAVVYDMAGNAVYTQALRNESGLLKIETATWAKGVYMLSLTDENGIAARRKIVVQ